MTPDDEDNSVAGAKEAEPGDYWAAFDDLPFGLRHTLREALAEWDPAQILAVWLRWLERGYPGDVAAEAIAQSVRETDRMEVLRFSHQYRDRFGHESPHLAAGATIQRYGFGGHRRGRRRNA